MHSIEYTVDGEPQTSTEHQRTARQILVAAGLKPEERYLIELKGATQESYKDRMEEIIHLHPKQKFVTAYVGPVPVSW